VWIKLEEISHTQPCIMLCITVFFQFMFGNRWCTDCVRSQNIPFCKINRLRAE